MPVSRTLRGERTLPFIVANTGFLLERLGQDCHPLQFLRELTQNSIEAMGRSSATDGKIVWDVDWNTYDLSDEAAYKLSVTDNGDGMTGPEMVKFINQLSSSLSEQSLSGNYGVGAKIAAATRNHAGLIYMSWKNGVGAMIHWWKDPSNGVYGLRQIEPALDRLEQAYRCSPLWQSRLAMWMKYDEDIDPLRPHPRFHALLKRLEVD